MALRRYRDLDVLGAARKRIGLIFDKFERIYVAFSGGKDSTVMLHLVMEAAIARGRMVGVMFIDFEAQYAETIAHAMWDAFLGGNEMAEITFVRFLGSRWAPAGVANDPTRLNENWIPNVLAALRKQGGLTA